MEEKRIIEAALFMSPDGIDVSSLARIAGLGAIGYVEDLIKNLNDEYDKNGSVLMIKKLENVYQMSLKDEYFNAVSGLAKEAEIRGSALKVLAYISKHEPIMQSELAKIFGSMIYDYVGELTQKGFLSGEKKKLSKLLKTTPKFREYFTLKQKELPESQTAPEPTAIV